MCAIGNRARDGLQYTPGKNGAAPGLPKDQYDFMVTVPESMENQCIKLQERFNETIWLGGSRARNAID